MARDASATSARWLRHPAGNRPGRSLPASRPGSLRWHPSAIAVRDRPRHPPGTLRVAQARCARTRTGWHRPAVPGASAQPVEAGIARPRPRVPRVPAGSRGRPARTRKTPSDGCWPALPLQPSAATLAAAQVRNAGPPIAATPAHAQPGTPRCRAQPPRPVPGSAPMPAATLPVATPRPAVPGERTTTRNPLAGRVPLPCLPACHRRTHRPPWRPHPRSPSRRPARART